MRKAKTSRAKMESNYKKKMRKRGYTVEYYSPMRVPFKKAQAESRPTSDIMTLKDLRRAIAQETDQGARSASDRPKWIADGDDKNEDALFSTHTLFLLTNHKPHAPADDPPFWEEMMQTSRRKRRDIVFNRALIPTQST